MDHYIFPESEDPIDDISEYTSLLSENPKLYNVKRKARQIQPLRAHYGSSSGNESFYSGNVQQLSASTPIASIATSSPSYSPYSPTTPLSSSSTTTAQTLSNKSASQELYHYNQSLHLTHKVNETILARKKRLKRSKILIILSCLLCFMPILFLITMFFTVHYRCKIGTNRSFKTMVKQYDSRFISNLNVNSIAGDIEIRLWQDTDDDDDGGDGGLFMDPQKVIVKINMTSPDERYLNKIRSNINFLGDTLTVTVGYFSSFYFGCPETFIQVIVPQKLSHVLRRVNAYTSSGDIRMRNVGSTLVDLESAYGNIYVHNFTSPEVSQSFDQDTTEMIMEQSAIMDGSLVVKAGKGNVYLNDVRSSQDVRLRTVKGNIYVNNTRLAILDAPLILFSDSFIGDAGPPEMQVETSHGSVFVSNYSGSVFRGVTVYQGDVNIEVDRFWAGAFDLRITSTVGSAGVNDSLVAGDIHYFLDSKMEKKGIIEARSNQTSENVLEYISNSGNLKLSFV